MDSGAGGAGVLTPPPGYLPWSILEVGNGDTYGYYWPIGREDGAPVVCTLMHDAWAMLPVASSLAGCIRVQLVTGEGRVSELVCTAREFGINVDDIAVPDNEDDAEDLVDGREWASSAPRGSESDSRSAPSTSGLLVHDPGSPHLRFVAAKEAIAGRQLAEAEAHLKLALDRLPEYSDALALLAQVYRQQQNHKRTAETLMEAITSLWCFGASDRRKLLGWLQRLDDDVCPGCDDPLWKRRHELTFAEGVKEKNDYLVFEQLIEEYHRIGSGVRAVRLRILAGEFMCSETVSFWERHGWTKQKYRALLIADLERAGLRERLVAL